MDTNKSKLIANIFYGFIDFIFPSRCVNCGRSISLRDNCLCTSCLNSIEPLSNKCAICSGVTLNGKCTICSDKKWYIKTNITLGEYIGVLKSMLHSFKFQKRKRLSRHLSDMAYKEILKTGVNFDIITYVPMNRNKKWERGFNQSELIAKHLSQKVSRKYLPLLKEKMGTGTQRTLQYRDRFLNILNRYKIRNPGLIKGRRLLLIDDVFTTGATINECARLLLENGALEVYSLTIARVNLKEFGS